MVAQLYPLYFEELVRYMASLLESRAAAEDVVQETFVRALEHEAQLERLGLPQCRAWLYRTAKRICIDRFRRQNRLPPPDLERAAEDDLSHQTVAELVALLPEHERALFLLNVFEGYTAKELAELFGLQAPTVRQRLCSARARLRRLWYATQERSGGS